MGIDCLLCCRSGFVNNVWLVNCFVVFYLSFKVLSIMVLWNVKGLLGMCIIVVECLCLNCFYVFKYGEFDVVFCFFVVGLIFDCN